MMTQLLTPSLLLDATVMQRNIDRMNRHLAGHGVIARPHVKTAKCVQVIDKMVAGDRSARLTASTLREVQELLTAGYRDILYAVGIVPAKLAEVIRMAEQSGARLSIILDSQAMAEMAVAALERAASEASVDVFIELDVDEHRAGVAPHGEALLAIGQTLYRGGRSLLRGVMTHAGGAYACLTRDELAAMAEQERQGAVQAAQRLREAGIPCDEVSVGSTPTALAAQSFSGVTEVRVGVYVFNDLVMAGLGVCDEADIALSILTTVIGHQPRRNTLLIDAGWMALSSDAGTAGHSQSQGLGRIVERSAHAGQADDLLVCSANQEHGLVQRRDGAAIDFARYPIGTLLQVLPIHACATAAQFEAYEVVMGLGSEGASTGIESDRVESDGGTQAVVERLAADRTRWRRFGGWHG